MARCLLEAPSRGTSALENQMIPKPASHSDIRTAPVEIAPGTWWVGKRDPGAIFYANPYLRSCRGNDPKTGRPLEFNLLIDPGSSSDFATVASKVGAVIGGMERLSAIFINHQDPDVGSSASLISARYAPRAAIVCSEDTWRLIVHTNLPRQRFVATDRLKHGLRFPTGHVLQPVPSPFCHFRGAVMLYDPETRVLFTGDLFGGMTDPSARGLWADETDWAGMRAFHQLYMPTNAALARVVSTIRQLDPPVEIIAPQHGRIIRGEWIEYYLSRIARLQAGLDIIDEATDPSVMQAWSAVAKRVYDLARSFLGDVAGVKLAAASDLQDTVVADGDSIAVTGLGRWSVERLVEVLSEGEPLELAGPIQVEAVAAAAEYGLPTPHLDLEGMERTDVSMLIP